MVAMHCVASLPVSSTTMHDEPFDIKAYMGRWYQMYGDEFVAKTFEHGGVCATADYGLRPDGNVSVFNNQRMHTVDGPFKNVTGYATPGDSALHFLVKFPFSPSFAPYWILELGPKNSDGLYDYAIVSDNHNLGLYILARSVKDFETKYETKLLADVKQRGFKHLYNKPVKQLQDGCTYSLAPTT